MNRLSIRLNERPLRLSATLFALFCLTSLTSCRDRVGAPVDLSVAQKTLASAMEGWKDGKTPKDLLAGTPSIFVQETEWTDGATLQDYEIISDDQPAGPNLIAVVKLKLRNPQGKVSEKTATYVVGTSPSLTVYRNTMK